jgi:hypothetical protein
MIEFLPTFGLLLVIPGAILGAMYYLNKGKGVHAQANIENNELQKIINECLLPSDQS